MKTPSQTPVRFRRVFYIPGYDPFPPRRYRELYRKEAKLQSEISGYRIDLHAAHAKEGFGWRVDASFAGNKVTSDVEVLIWSDIVQKSRPSSVFLTYVDLIRTAWIYISSGALFRLMRLRKGPVIAALYPVVTLIFQAVLAAVLAWAAFNVATIGLDWVMPGTHPLARIVFGTIAWGLLFVSVLRWFQKNDGRFFAFYLMHDFAYTASQRGAYPAELEARLAVFRHKLKDALHSEADEVLIVGHSSGAHLAVSLISDLLRQDGLPAQRPALALLSLGQVVPMVSFLPKAKRLRRDLLVLSQSDDVTWVDVSAPGDGCCFALCDPVAVTSIATPNKRGPLVFSAAFSKSLKPKTWRALRWRFFRLHFQYLCAFDQPRDYDYFQITAGPSLLADRYAGRAPSRSRIETPVNAFVSVDP